MAPLTLLTGTGRLRRAGASIRGRAHLDAVAEEINEMLEAVGHLSIGDLYKRFSLPLEIVTQVITTRLGRGIGGQRDASNPLILYTPAYIARQRAIVRGAALATARYECPRRPTGSNDR